MAMINKFHKLSTALSCYDQQMWNMINSFCFGQYHPCIKTPIKFWYVTLPHCKVHMDGPREIDQNVPHCSTWQCLLRSILAHRWNLKPLGTFLVKMSLLILPKNYETCPLYAADFYSPFTSSKGFHLIFFSIFCKKRKFKKLKYNFVKAQG